MNDILDYIREQLASQPCALETIDPILRAARQTFGGDTVYIRQLRIRDLSPGSVRGIATRNQVSRRTAQRWKKAT